MDQLIESEVCFSTIIFGNMCSDLDHLLEIDSCGYWLIMLEKIYLYVNQTI